MLATFDDPRRSLHVWGTHSDIGPLRYSYVLSIDTPSDMTLTLADLGATRGADYVLLDFWGANGSAPAAFAHVPAGGALVVPRSPPPPDNASDAGTYQVLSPGVVVWVLPPKETRRVAAAAGHCDVALTLSCGTASNGEDACDCGGASR
eukprot:gene54058-51930_t